MARSAVSGISRLPSPPARTIARTLRREPRCAAMTRPYGLWPTLGEGGGLPGARTAYPHPCPPAARTTRLVVCASTS
ncbi:hypothetical protein [Ornithinimicrobium kibberense]|uniref:hypothetical protein n=1 Tax=Ornithinimicrobium kibberense TaxID=282060 RepID=UPI003614F461